MGIAASRQEAFWEACGFGHKLRVQKFLEAGDIDVNWVSYTHDCCPIHVASQGKPEIVKMLIDAKCNVNVQDIRGLTPVHHAAMKGHADIIKTLVEAGAEVNTQDKNYWTALHCAAYWNQSEAVRVLLNLGADVKLLNKDKRTALHETARSKEKDDFSLGEITQMLISEGSDVNCKGCSDLGDLEADFTGLMYASYHNHPDVASALIDGGCDINAHGSNLWTALHWAADRGHEEMVYLLLGAGADPTKRGQRNELAADRAEKTDLKEMLLNAVNMFTDLESLNASSNEQLPYKANLLKSVPVEVEISKNLKTKEDSTINKQNDERVINSQNTNCDHVPDEINNLSISEGVDKLTLDSKQNIDTVKSTSVLKDEESYDHEIVKSEEKAANDIHQGTPDSIDGSVHNVSDSIDRNLHIVTDSKDKTCQPTQDEKDSEIQ